MAEDRTILVRDGKAGLPYSKGILATSVLAVGLSPDTAYRIAIRVEGRLRAGGVTEITATELRDVTAEVLREDLGEEAAARYLRWQAAQERDRPLIVLIGGTTGVGKSSVATQLAYRLGIVRIVSTDAVREVMRGMVSAELLPTLHVSSFRTGEVWDQLKSPDTDLLLAGFVRQASVVASGVRQLVRRAVVEQSDLIVEGVHLLPGGLELPSPEEAVVVQLVLVLDDIAAHRSHFLGRRDSTARPSKRYLDYLDEIRRIQDELVRRAQELGVPTVPSYDLDQTVAEVTSLVVDSLTAAAHPRGGSTAALPETRTRRTR